MSSKYKRVHPKKWAGVYAYELGDLFDGKPDVCYFINFRLGGRLRWEKIGKASEGYTPSIAAELRAKRVRTVRHGEEVKTNREILEENAARDRTFGEVAKRYFEAKGSELKGRTTDMNRYEKHLASRFSKSRIGEVRPLDIEALKSSMSARAAATVWNTLELFRRIINYGHKAGICPPLGFHIEMPRKDNEVVEYLAAEEIQRLFDTLEAWPSRDVAHMLELAFVSALRRGEIFKLQDDDLDFHMRIIRLRAPKGGRTTSVPMSQAAKEILQRQMAWRDEHHPGSRFLFPGRNGGQRTDCGAVDRVKEKAGLPKSFRPFHGLRHHYAVTLANSGEFSLDMIAELMTHKGTAMTRRYAQFLPETLNRAGEVAARLLRKGIGGGGE